jgi:hypothetical protein
LRLASSRSTASRRSASIRWITSAKAAASASSIGRIRDSGTPALARVRILMRDTTAAGPYRR